MAHQSVFLQAEPGELVVAYCHPVEDGTRAGISFNIRGASNSKQDIIADLDTLSDAVSSLAVDLAALRLKRAS